MEDEVWDVRSKEVIGPMFYGRKSGTKVVAELAPKVNKGKRAFASCR